MKDVGTTLVDYARTRDRRRQAPPRSAGSSSSRRSLGEASNVPPHHRSQDPIKLKSPVQWHKFNTEMLWRERERDWKTLTKLITQGLSFDLLQCDKNVPAALSMRESIRRRSSLRTAPVISKRVRVSTQINNKSFFCAKIMSFILSNFIKKIELSKDKKQLVKKITKHERETNPSYPKENGQEGYIWKCQYIVSVDGSESFFFPWQAHR